MAHHPEHDIATALGSTLTLLDPPGGTVALTYPGNVVRGPTRAPDDVVPNELISILGSGGPGPSPYLGEPPNENLYMARVQVTVRSKVGDYDGGNAIARAVRAALHLVAIASPEYVDVRAQQSEPNYIGEEDRGVHRWTVNFVLRYRA